MSLIIRQVLLGKVQTAHGSPAVPTVASDAILCNSLQFNYANTKMLDRDVKRGIKGSVAQIYAGSLGEITFECELKGSGAAGTAPEISAALVASGMAETVAAGVSVSYGTATLNQQYMTFYFNHDGVQRVLTDAVGDFNIDLSAGEKGMVSFTFTGHLGAETDVTYAAGAYASTVPVPVIGAAFSVGGYAASVTKLSLARGNSIVTPASMSAADGFGQIRIGSWDVNGSFDPLATLLATQNFVADWKAGVNKALDSGVIGSTAGNRYQITAPAIRYRSVSNAKRDSELSHELSYGAHSVSGDDEFSLVFT